MTRIAGWGSVVVAMLATVVGAQPFHTSPECWSEPRLYHAGEPSAELAARVHVVAAPALGAVPDDADTSPNGAYRMWMRPVDRSVPGPWDEAIVFEVEREQRPTLILERVNQPLRPRWLNEKLVFVRAAWGRVVFSDIIFDVEAGRILWHEEVRDGRIAYEQFRQACGGRCPCETEAEDGVPPSRPASGAIVGLLELPEIYGTGEAGGPRAAAEPSEVAVYVTPDETSTPTRTTTATGFFLTREVSYEHPAVVVHEVREDWYRVALRGERRSGWVRAASGRRFHPVADLLVRRQTYLNEHWRGTIWARPGAGAPSVVRADAARGSRETPVEIRAAREVDGGLWLHIGVYAGDPCEGGDRGFVAEGWIPAYSAAGDLVAWFHARGC